jgi:hypothetical protein
MEPHPQATHGVDNLGPVELQAAQQAQLQLQLQEQQQQQQEEQQQQQQQEEEEEQQQQQQQQQLTAETAQQPEAMSVEALALHRAAASGDLPSVWQLLKQGTGTSLLNAADRVRAPPAYLHHLPPPPALLVRRQEP